ncbi:hypothetical protein RhiirA4_467752 [Rhizophagus irregularis]|uniref:Uncharacterized protein n=1 Tax=Rhizophagus irregularis TaxID=588596 RepID=A0A2I1GWE2_9GLOM|nr:hypothetical protein RhiirA4_467752 [Rhizophagus irregularis]
MSKNTSSTLEEVTNKFIEEFYKEYLDKSEALPRGIFSPEGRSKDSESRGSEEKLSKMETELSERTKNIASKSGGRKFKQTILLGLENRARELEKYKETITDLENRIRELEVDVTVKKQMKLEKDEVRIITKNSRF